MFDYTNDCPIFVPEASVDSYKSASGWSDYADRIRAPRLTYIRYTSSDGQIVEPYSPQNFGANIVSNEYMNGQGVITLDGLVTVFGGAEFKDCTTLTSIQIPESVVRIEGSAFVYCTSLESVSLPEGLTYLGGGSFLNCSSLKTLSIPDGVTAIEYHTFRGCSSLESISIPDHVTTIGQNAFADCSSLAFVSIPNSVTSLSWGAFENCTSLTSVTIPENVREMNYAFHGCTELKSVTMLPYYPPTAIGAFGYEEDGSLNEDLIIYVPEGRADAYKSAFYWSDLADHIFEIDKPTAVDMGLSVK